MVQFPLHSAHEELLSLVNNPATRDESFGAFYDAFSRRVYAYALRMTQCRDTASDITQETFIRVHAHLKRGNTIVDPLPFCIMLARQRVANVVRDEKEQLSVHESCLVVDPYEAILAADLSVHIVNAVESLPAALREAFILRYYDGLSYDTIAEMISESAGSVRMRVHRAKALLRQQLVHVRSDVR